MGPGGSHGVRAQDVAPEVAQEATRDEVVPGGQRDRRRPAPSTSAGDVPPEQRGKGRPTPKRREAQARHHRPVVVTDRKAARKRAKAERDEAWRRQQAGIAAGDERYFMPRDRGPARRFARDYVDARWNIGELMLPAALMVFLLLFLQGVFPQVVAWGVIVIYAVLLACVLDAAFVAFSVTRNARAKFGADNVPRWTGWYAAMRSLQIRRLRTPKPAVTRGGRRDTPVATD